MRPGRACTAAASSLNRQTLVESAISSSLGLAPTIGASLAAMRVGQSIQSCFVQLAMRSSPHCRSAVSASAAGADLRQRAQRIAVEIDDAVRQTEPLAREGERVGGVELLGFVEVHSRHRESEGPAPSAAVEKLDSRFLGNDEAHSLGSVTPFCPIYLPARSA